MNIKVTIVTAHGHPITFGMMVDEEELEGLSDEERERQLIEWAKEEAFDSGTLDIELGVDE